MIITRTPYRISFFGGGTDYREWFEENGGSVLATTIDKYCYVTCRYLPPFFKHKSRIIYSKREQAKNIDEIQHLSVRETLKFMNIKKGVEIHHDGDLPARTGPWFKLSIHCRLAQCTLYALKGKMVTRRQLALDAIHIKQD